VVALIDLIVQIHQWGLPIEDYLQIGAITRSEYDAIMGGDVNGTN
jgi:hypothetical protein